MSGSDKKTKVKPPPISIGAGGEAHASDSPDGGFISGVGSTKE